MCMREIDSGFIILVTGCLDYQWWYPFKDSNARRVISIKLFWISAGDVYISNYCSTVVGVVLIDFQRKANGYNNYL